jgi:4-amino-4-deoxy-L-arabinose transferase-like glycosyltransferase
MAFDRKLMRRARSMLIIAAAALTLLWFGLLAGRPLYEPDEGRYAEIPREMLAGGDWIIPHLNGVAYLEKPPLQYWITALIYRALGESEATARLCTGLAGYLSLLTVFLVAYRLWGLEAGVKAVLLCAGSVLFVLLGHQLTLDMTLSFFLLLCLSCFLLAQSQRANQRRSDDWMLGCWAAMALAVLTKGLIGIVIPGGTLALYMLWQRDREALKHLNFRWGLPLFAVIAVPWFVLAARANPAFIQFFFIREHFQRYLTAIEQRSEPWWFFLPVLGIGILPWLPLAFKALTSPWRNALPRGQFDPSRVLWVWSVLVLVFFSLSNAKLIPYVLPAVPALALLCAHPKVADSRGALTAGALLSIVTSLCMLAYVSAQWSSTEGLALALEIRPVIIWTAVLLATAGVACGIFVRQRRDLAALAALCACWYLAACTILLAAHSAQKFYSARDLALVLRNVLDPPSAPVYEVQTYDQSLPFYLKRPVIMVDHHDEFTLGLTQAPERGISTLAEFSRRWRSSSAGYAVMPLATYERLSAENLPMRTIDRFPEKVLVSRR